MRRLLEWVYTNGNKNNTVQNNDPRPGNLQRWFKLLGALTKYFKSQPGLQNYRLVDTHIQSSRYGLMFYDDSKGGPPEGTTITFDMSSESFSFQEDFTGCKTNGKGFDNLIDELEKAIIPELAHFDFSALKEDFNKGEYDMKLFEEFKEYEDMWEDLTEWVTYNGNTSQTNNNNQNTSTAPASNDPIARAINKMKKNSSGLGDYKDKFIKLARHLGSMYKIDSSYQYARLNEHHLCLVFETPSGTTIYLDVTTTKADSSNFKFKEYWDYVLQEMQPYNHIINRGHISGYDELLDILFRYGVISSKAACV